MRKIREVLQLYFAAALSIRAIARSVGTSPSTVADYLRRAEGSGLSWPVPEAVDDAWLERRLFPALPPSSPSRPLPEWSEVHRELGRKGVTLSLLSQEYKALHPEGLQYSWFCEQYRAWAADLLELLEDRHAVRSTVVTSQLPVDKWHDVVGGPTLADAILDRLVHNAYKLELKGDSMRKRGRPAARTENRNS